MQMASGHFLTELQHSDALLNIWINYWGAALSLIMGEGTLRNMSPRDRKLRDKMKNWDRTEGQDGTLKERTINPQTHPEFGINTFMKALISSVPFSPHQSLLLSFPLTIIHLSPRSVQKCIHDISNSEALCAFVMVWTVWNPCDFMPKFDTGPLFKILCEWDSQPFSQLFKSGNMPNPFLKIEQQINKSLQIRASITS